MGPGDLVQESGGAGQTAPSSEWIVAPKGTACEAPALGAGHVVFRVGTRIFRIEARVGAQPEDLSAQLDRFSRGEEKFVNTSPNGEWLVIATSRFGCKPNECLAVVNKNMCAAQVVRVAGEALDVNGEGAAVSNDGATIVFPAQGGPHKRDLFVTHRKGNDYTAPKVLTASSPLQFHQQPAISDDGRRVVFDCGPKPTAETGSSICEVNLDGTGFHVVVSPDSGPWGNDGAPHHPDYSPDGRIVFESTWDGDAEQVWDLPSDADSSTKPQSNEEVQKPGTDRVCAGRSFTNDNSPCVLPDGRMVSLWLGRHGSGGHELKIMSADCRETNMLLTDVDIEDVGLGCSR